MRVCSVKIFCPLEKIELKKVTRYKKAFKLAYKINSCSVVTNLNYYFVREVK